MGVGYTLGAWTMKIIKAIVKFIQVYQEVRYEYIKNHKLATWY